MQGVGESDFVPLLEAKQASQNTLPVMRLPQPQDACPKVDPPAPSVRL
jgi:hypothetical protein